MQLKIGQKVRYKEEYLSERPEEEEDIGINEFIVNGYFLKGVELETIEYNSWYALFHEIEPIPEPKEEVKSNSEEDRFKAKLAYLFSAISKAGFVEREKSIKPEIISQALKEILAINEEQINNKVVKKIKKIWNYSCHCFEEILPCTHNFNQMQSIINEVVSKQK